MVGSIPSFTRSGLPSPSCSASRPSGSASTAPASQRAALPSRLQPAGLTAPMLDSRQSPGFSDRRQGPVRCASSAGISGGRSSAQRAMDRMRERDGRAASAGRSLERAPAATGAATRDAPAQRVRGGCAAGKPHYRAEEPAAKPRLQKLRFSSSSSASRSSPSSPGSSGS